MDTDRLKGIEITAIVSGDTQSEPARSNLRARWAQNPVSGKMEMIWAVKESDCHTVPRGIGTMNFTATSNDTYSASNLNWWIQRNNYTENADRPTNQGGPNGGPRPIFNVPDTSNPLNATLDTSTNSPWGCFNVILFNDTNNPDPKIRVYEPRWFNDDGTRNESVVPLCYFNLVLVDFDIIYDSLFYANDSVWRPYFLNEYMYIGSGSGKFADNQFAPKAAMQCEAHIVARGGGKDCALGLTKIDMGMIQNGVSTVPWPIVGTYDNANQRRDTITDKVSWPILDSGRNNLATGGNTIFLFKSESSVEIPVIPPGWVFEVRALDIPNGGMPVNWSIGIDTTPLLVNLSGGYSFQLYLAAYSTDFKFTYCIIGRAGWKVDFEGIKNPKGEGGKNNNSKAWGDFHFLGKDIFGIVSYPLNAKADHVNVKITGPAFGAPGSTVNDPPDTPP